MRFGAFLVLLLFVVYSAAIPEVPSDMTAEQRITYLEEMLAKEKANLNPPKHMPPSITPSGYHPPPPPPPFPKMPSGFKKHQQDNDLPMDSVRATDKLKDEL